MIHSRNFFFLLCITCGQISSTAVVFLFLWCIFIVTLYRSLQVVAIYKDENHKVYQLLMFRDGGEKTGRKASSYKLICKFELKGRVKLGPYNYSTVLAFSGSLLQNFWYESLIKCTYSFDSSVNTLEF